MELSADAEIDRQQWWARIPAVRALLDHGLNIPAGVTFLVGENGSGKSTLIEALAMATGLNPEGGSRGAMHSTRATESPLAGALRVIRTPGRRVNSYFLRAETTHGLYTYLESLPGENPDRGLHDQSHGEGFLELLSRKFRGYGFYLMDEPEAPLSFTSTLGLLAKLDELRATGAQVVIATHSPLLTALPGATILSLDASGIRKVAWEDLEIVADWRGFLASPTAYLRRL
ncbi:ABC transporter, ATP-binding protein [Paractinoplanes deccanensis]|uniref:ABC transporter, ATP-binding protein n=1 Tax=Paractinoplanes deccanensis TaxID=113561 RepID=A0ABQ3YIU0_9ACTN|nr:AAA family ATPase [Actinoplanes deccanensis]GID79928.1 ABC transporter, ATP-binding protein [Actinoplanes deccanensis]